MNWLRILIAGLLLAESPFHLKTDNYYFFYSILGYGLILISFLFKKSRNISDWIIFSLTAVIVLTGLFNQFFLWYLFQLFLFAAITAVYTAHSGKLVIYRFSLVLTGAAGALIAIHVGNAMGFTSYRAFILNSQYFFLSALAGVFIVNYREFSRQRP